MQQSRCAPRSEYFAVAGGGGGGRLTPSSAADSGHSMVLDGHSRLLPRRQCHGPADATRLVHRYNADGWPGWRTGPGLASASSGRSQRSEVAKWVEDA